MIDLNYSHRSKDSTVPSGISEVGARVVTPSGDVGHIEEGPDDTGMVRVRCLTPKNKPSCCSSWCNPHELKDGTNVVPMPRSKAWHAESRAFCLGVEGVLKDADI